MDLPTKKQIDEYIECIKESPRKVNVLPVYNLHFRVELTKIRNSISILADKINKLCKEKEIEFSSHPTAQDGTIITTTSEYVEKFSNAVDKINQALEILAEGTTLKQKIGFLNEEAELFQFQLDEISQLMEDPNINIIDIDV